MNRKAYFSVVMAFLLGLTVATYASKKKPAVTSNAWQDVSTATAAENLLGLAEQFAAKDGSWENIQFARVLYMSGNHGKADEIFSRYQAGKLKADELVRIARVYAHAGEWQKAKPLYDQVAELKPTDADWLAEAGAFYNLNGDRETAERLFQQSFDEEPRNLKNTLSAAGSYLGVPPRVR